MIAEQRNWACVNVDSYIRDANGVAWRIAAIDETEATPGMTGAFRAKNRAGTWVDITPKPLEAPVTILFPPEVDSSTDQIALLRDKLGATVIGQQDRATKEVSCEIWPEIPASKNLSPWRKHLTDMHDMYAEDIKGYAKLVAAHEAAHDPDQPRVGKHRPHTHQEIS